VLLAREATRSAMRPRSRLFYGHDFGSGKNGTRRPA